MKQSELARESNVLRVQCAEWRYVYCHRKMTTAQRGQHGALIREAKRARKRLRDEAAA